MVKSISESYLALNETLHDDKNFGSRPDCGGLAVNLAKTLNRLRELEMCSSYLDYGCGKGNLVKHLASLYGKSLTIIGFDPAVKEWSQKPNQTFDFVSCLDVLEHVESKFINSALEEISDLTDKFAYIAIDLQPAVKTLKNGRNAHIMLAPFEWWSSKISEHFPTNVSFPVMHKKGFQQKAVFICAKEGVDLEYILLIASKLKADKIKMTGGLVK